MKKLLTMALGLALAISAAAQDTDYLSKDEIIDLYVNLYLYSEQTGIEWNGNTTYCNPGTLSEDVLTAAEIRINFFRLANRLNTISLNPYYNAEAQQAALLCKANNTLTHAPTSNMKCYSEAAASGCQKSCLGMSDYENFPGTAFISGFMQDYGESNYYVGHRRWLLYSKLLEAGYGATDKTEAVHTVSGITYDEVESPEFISYPWSGYVPVELIYPKWSFSIPEGREVNFDQVKITMTDAQGRNIPLKKYNEYKGFLDPTIVWSATGLFTDYDITYGQNHMAEKGYLDKKITVKIDNVLVDGVKKSYQYFVEPFQLEE